MFGLPLIPNLASIRGPKVDPKDVPPPTPVVFPRPHEPGPTASDPESSSGLQASTGLVESIQGVCRPSDIGPRIFDALALQTRYNVKPAELLPDPSYLPDFDAWDKLTQDEAREKQQETRRPLSNGNLSPGCQTYYDRKTELSILNEDAFRTVRRQPAKKGKKQPRLGNSYEFFRCLEMMTPYWDDPSAPPRPTAADDAPKPDAEAAPSSNEAAGDTNGKVGEEASAEEEEDDRIYRTMVGTAMPPEHRHSLLSAFIKLVAYDFGCNVTTPRAEPRLQLCSAAPADRPGASPRKSYIPSGCIFVFRSPTKREHARAGLVDGPIAAVSARGTVSFESETENVQDLAREILAALVTAQHRAREGKTEQRMGEGQWWTKEKRWGGGSGGPIGREAEMSSNSSSGSGGDAAGGDKDSGAPPAAKKPKRQMAAYDNYRMIRPPSLTWDKKTRYEAIGRPVGVTEWDDVFVISSLFHHVSVLRARVPKKLLDVFEGSAEDAVAASKSWGELVVWRSEWYDLFVAEERIRAVQLLWGLFAYQMRKNEGDVAMKDA